MPHPPSTIVVVLAALGVATPALSQTPGFTTEQLQYLTFRQPGPAVTGGRIHDVEALPDDPSTIYVATASGGLWKTTNKGTTWTALFQHEAVSTFGDIGVSLSNPDILYVGTGEQNNRQSTSWGNGVYRSDDGGTTWRHLGLVETRHIGRVVVHPTDPDIVYVAALGNLWKPSADRGVYQSTDGGRTWVHSLVIDTLTGVVDLVMDPRDPSTLYAAAYQRLRRTWGFNGGGPGSGIYKTIDGGATWRELTNGIPGGDLGRIGLAISATNPLVLNATIEHATAGGTYRTENGGERWERVNPLNQRPMYYSQLRIDPTNELRVYQLATSFYKSEDGGRAFRTMPSRQTYDVGVHSDFHGMWIDPGDPEHFYLVGDGGFYESWDLGETYLKIANLPIAQFYGIGVDHRQPYYVYGGLQDNHSFMGPSATRSWIGILNDDWRQIGFGDGMYHQPDPTDPRYVYGNAQNGNIVRLDATTGDLLNIRPYPPEIEASYRWDWVTPILLSQHDPRVVYFGGNRLFISRDRGVSWSRTDDLTRQIDRDTLTLMGVRGGDITLSRNDGTSSFGEIVTIAESPRDPNVIWVGTDDGNVQVSRDQGITWAEVSVNVPGVPSGTYVSRIIASEAARDRAYATFDAHRDGDFLPYVFRTEDLGATWTSIEAGLPEGAGSANVIKEHPRNPDLLFLGTEHGLFVSPNGGAQWTQWRANLPTTLYDDLVIHPRDNDLILGTHGRSIFIFDDLTPLVEWSQTEAGGGTHLFSIRPATIKQFWKDTSYRTQQAYAGENPPDGAIISFLAAGAEATLTVRSPLREVVREMTVPTEPTVIHRVVWDLRHAVPGVLTADEEQPPGLPHPVVTRGPHVSPGTYDVTVVSGGIAASRTVRVLGDPEMPVTVAEYRERERFLLEIQRVQAGLLEAARRLSDTGSPSGGSGAASPPTRQEHLQRLAGQAGQLAAELNGNGVRQGSLYPPTTTQRERWDALAAKAREALATPR